MKKLVLIGLLFIGNFVSAQAPTYDDLRILYADGNYEKLIKVAEKYTLDDKTKKDPLTHMWLGRGLYQMSLSGTDDEKFKNAYKEAIGAIGKSIKYDSDGAVQSEYAEFYDKFKASLVETISNELSAEAYAKASSWVLKYYKINPTSIGAKYLDGACKFRNSDKGGANTCWKDAEKMMGGLTSLDGWAPAEKELLKIGVLQTAECLVKSRQTEKAKTLLGKVAQWFEEDEIGRAHV